MITAKELREKFSKLSVLVVGDICLDIDYIGGYSGYSREVEQLPIFRAEKVKYSPGGGGNLAVCFATLGVKTTTCGYWGNYDDINGFYVKEYFKKYNIHIDGMLMGDICPVFGKLYLHNGQHIYRFDIISAKIPKSTNEIMTGNVAKFSPLVDFVACADYEEVHEFGVCSPEVIDAVRHNAIVKFATSRKHVARFEGFDYMIQNQKELNEQFHHNESYYSLNLKDMVVTLGGQGARTMTPKEVVVPSKELTENIDPCGCGDMFYAAYSASVMSGYDTETCLKIANSAARVVAKKLFGTGQADCEEIVKEWEVLYADR